MDELKFIVDPESPPCDNLVVVAHKDHACAGWNSNVPKLTGYDSRNFERYKGDHFVDINYVDKTVIVSNGDEKLCRYYPNPYITIKTDVSGTTATCAAVVRIKGLNAAYHQMRYDMDPKLGSILPGTSQLVPSGFFRKASILNGRVRLALKLNPLFSNMIQVEKKLLNILQSHGFMPDTNADIIVMVVNDGEMDLFINFACSCHQHGISLSKILVFAASEEIVPFIEATGAMGIYHESFAFVHKDASEIYLDRTFVDMMWYKAFSVWLVLRVKYNVLFQVFNIYTIVCYTLIVYVYMYRM